MKYDSLKPVNEYKGAVIVVSHDVPFLQSWPRSIWHLEHEQISLFHGSYDAFLTEQENHRAQLIARKEKLMTEKRALIREAETISPPFTLSHHAHATSGIYVREGSVGYDQTPIVRDISLSVEYGERVALTGANGSGKSTLIKALHSNPTVIRDGTWQLPRAELIGYLDQHYRIVTEHDTAVSAVKTIHPDWTEREVRTHLSRFLFRTHGDVTTPTHHLSGGERARLALALIAAQSPSILLLDEITNNIDLATREHCLQVLTSFPGTLIVISHDDDFLQRLNCTSWYTVAHGTLTHKEHA